jgi:glycine dehydrogenase subunit 2
MKLTNPNPLGLFEERLEDVIAAVHRVGGLMYGDGANMNALLGIARPGDLGFDVIHLNLHKTFSTPHGAGGPGAGPVLANESLAPFLPVPRVVRDADGTFRLSEDRPQSVGRVRAFHGNYGVLVRAYSYIRNLGEEGLRACGEEAILAANYLLSLLRPAFTVAYDRPCMHEFVLSAAAQKKAGASALDISKALIDEGFHPPTVYFPLIVSEALMIEPTETEPKETLDAFAAALRRIADRVKTDPASVHDAPRAAPLRRLDEVGAARRPRLRWQAGS